MFTRSTLRARRLPLVAGAVAAVVLVGGGIAGAITIGSSPTPFGTSQVSRTVNGRVLVNTDQWISSYGQRTTFTSRVVGSTVSPDGTKAAVQTGGVGAYDPRLSILDAASGSVLQSFAGNGVAAPVYSPDGTALYVVNDSGEHSRNTNTVSKFTLGSDGLVTNPTSPQKLTFPSATVDHPAAPALTADGTKLYVPLYGTNQVAVVDTATMQVTDRITVGNAPYDVAIVGDQAFVSNRGGRAATSSDTTDISGDASTPIVSDPETGASTTGTVSVIDLDTNAVTDTINVGLQPASLTVHDGSVFVTNTSSDTVSVIDAASHKVTQTFSVEPLPGSTVGAAPNSVTFPNAHTLLVSVGRDNAIAVFGYNGPQAPVQYQGLIPTDWYPDEVSYDAKVGKVIVSNERGIGDAGDAPDEDMRGTLTSFSLPDNLTLGTMTRQVFDNNNWDHLSSSTATTAKAASGPLPAIPAELGQPSAIKHVFLIIKENKTYDSVLGDIAKGNGDPKMTVYGAKYTPNEHSLSNTFGLFDNFYEESYNTVDGHVWMLQSDANDYMEHNLSSGTGLSRARGDGDGDSLEYQPSGFLWNTVEATGKSVKVYGEANDWSSTGTLGSWQQYYADSQILEGKASGTLPVPIGQYQQFSDIPSLNAISNHDFPNFVDPVPDQFRVDVWEQDFKQAEKTGDLPNLTIIGIGNDHTGLNPADPDAEVADNDLATGRIISDISHSQFWKDSAAFVVEDDPGGYADHVDSARSPVWIASPYAKRGVVDSTYYTQVSVVKTIEQILGARPLNQVDRAAVPMTDAFTSKPNYTPYTVVPETVPLTEGVPNLTSLSPPAGSSDTPAQAAALAATSGPAAPAVPAAEKSVAAAWANWDDTVVKPTLKAQGGDSVNAPQLSRWDWYIATDWSKPYPGDTKILAPDQVPGRNLPGGTPGD